MLRIFLGVSKENKVLGGPRRYYIKFTKEQTSLLSLGFDIEFRGPAAMSETKGAESFSLGNSWKISIGNTLYKSYREANFEFRCAFQGKGNLRAPNGPPRTS